MRREESPVESDAEDRPSGGPPDWRRLLGRLRGPFGVLVVAALTVAGLGVLYTLYLARSFLVPVTAAIFLNYLLTPVVRFGERRLNLPTPVGALAVFLVVVGVTAVTVYGLAGPAMEWLDSAPQRVEEAERQLRSVSESVENVREAVDSATATGNQGGGEDESVQVESESVSSQLLSRAQEMLLGLVSALFLLFFLLASGDLFLRKTIISLPRWKDRRRVVEISRRIESDLSHFLLTKSIINASLGLAVGIAMWLWGIPNPALWGVLAAFLNFIPYIGGAAGMTLLAVVGLVTFDSVGRGLLPALTYLALNGLEAYLITPSIMGRRFSMNSVAVFVSVLFWGWIWGIAGALMAVPILTTVVIICSRIEPLRPVARFLER